MQKRQSHRKSRNGCQNCKKRHVKCDEQGPPCGNCVVRKSHTTCDFQANTPSPSTTTTSESTTTATTTTTNSSSSLSNIPHPPFHPTPSRRLLELELMHRWATFTYRSFCDIEADTHYARVILPQGAWKHDFLLHMTLATAALEISVTTNINDEDTRNPQRSRNEYARAALEYYDAASLSFRTTVLAPEKGAGEGINKENMHFVYMFAAMAALFNMAIPRETGAGGPFAAFEQSMVERMAVLMNLFVGAGSLVLSNWEWMVDSPILASLISGMSLMEQKPPDLDLATEQALARLDKVVQSYMPSSSSSYPEEEPKQHAVEHQQEQQQQQQENINTAVQQVAADEPIPNTNPYTIALSHLRLCFVEDAKDLIKGFCISFPMFAGRDFVQAFARSEPPALLIVMYWGVLLDRLGRLVWWARDAGRSLVEDISEALVRDVPGLVVGREEWWEGMAWARGMVGLEPLVCPVE